MRDKDKGEVRTKTSWWQWYHMYRMCLTCKSDSASLQVLWVMGLDSELNVHSTLTAGMSSCGSKGIRKRTMSVHASMRSEAPVVWTLQDAKQTFMLTWTQADKYHLRLC